MARLPYLGAADLDGADEDIVKSGMNLHRILAHSPDAARCFSGLARHLRLDSSLDAPLREMAILQTVYMTKSAYAYSHHLQLSRKVGVTDNDVKAIETETAGGASGLPALLHHDAAGVLDGHALQADCCGADECVDEEQLD